MADLNNPMNVLYQDETTGQPVPVRQDTPLPVSGAVTVSGVATQTTLAAILASIGAAGDAAGADTVIGQLKQININTTTP